MRRPRLVPVLLAIFVMSAVPQDYGQGGRPIPPGVREADKQTNAPTEAPTSPAKHKKADPALLKREAEELSQLSARIPAAIDAVNQGQLPKELEDQLKRIEKLAKHLRSEISP